MHMIGVGVRSDDRLRVFAEVLSHQSFGYLVCELRGDVFGIGKTDNVVYRFDRRFPAFGLGCIITAAAVLFVNSFICVYARSASVMQLIEDVYSSSSVLSGSSM